MPKNCVNYAWWPVSFDKLVAHLVKLRPRHTLVCCMPSVEVAWPRHCGRGWSPGTKYRYFSPKFFCTKSVVTSAPYLGCLAFCCTKCCDFCTLPRMSCLLLHKIRCDFCTLPRMSLFLAAQNVVTCAPYLGCLVFCCTKFVVTSAPYLGCLVFCCTRYVVTFAPYLGCLVVCCTKCCDFCTLPRMSCPLGTSFLLGDLFFASYWGWLLASYWGWLFAVSQSFWLLSTVIAMFRVCVSFPSVLRVTLTGLNYFILRRSWIYMYTF